MIKASIYIDKYNWWLHCYVAVTHYDSEEIILRLWDLGCNGDMLLGAENNLRKSEVNSGLTYSSYPRRETILITALTSSAKEFYNSIQHELCHACCHIANASYINKNDEEFAYLIGDVSMQIYPYIKNLLCDCCRKKQFE